MLVIDTETTGLDFHHGARAYLVTTYDDTRPPGEELRWWPWHVDPITRMPEIPEEDVLEIQRAIQDADLLVLQNGKFDYRALLHTDSRMVSGWDWGKVRDTLIAGHLLASNKPHGLDAMAVQYLRRDISRYEKKIQAHTQAARRWCRRHRKDWAIAKAGREDMPSAKDKTWKVDMWLPMQLLPEIKAHEEAIRKERETKKRKATKIKEVDTEGWETSLEEYANTDSFVTYHVWKKQEAEIHRRDLWAIYENKMAVLSVAVGMEERGISLHRGRVDEKEEEYQRESEDAGALCVGIARSVGVTLQLPKTGGNNSLRELCFGRDEYIDDDGNYHPRAPGLDLPVVRRTDAGAPSLDKYALEIYEAELPLRSKQRLFCQALAAKRKRDTALSYLQAYRRFWRPLQLLTGSRGAWEQLDPEDWWRLLHPYLNPTGSDTLRWSSSNPNEQNISKKEGFNLRYCFGPAPGREWWSLDARGIEDRLPAYESQEQELIEIFEKPKAPPYFGSNHLLRFHTVYPDIWAKHEKEIWANKDFLKKTYGSTFYQWVKNGGFAVQYGAIDRTDGKGTADLAFHRAGSHALLKARFNKLEKLNQQCINHANRHGYVETMPYRPVDPLKGYPLLCSRTERNRVKPTVPLNYHIQGTAMYWMHQCMLNCQALLDDWNSRLDHHEYFMVMQVHDELVFDFPKRGHPKTQPKHSNLGKIRTIQKTMERVGMDLVPSIPTPVSVEYHPVSWDHGESF